LPTSLCSRIDSRLWEELLAGAPVIRSPAGSVLFQREDAPPLAAVTAGLVSVFTWAPGGRQVFLRYARPGDLIGVEGLWGDTNLLSAEAVTDATLAMVSSDRLHALATRNLDVSWALAEHIADWSVASVASLVAGFEQMTARVARHLLDIAVRTSDHRTIAHITHRGLACATGTVRESVTRVLRELRKNGIIDTGTGRVIVLDPGRLARVAEGEPAGGPQVAAPARLTAVTDSLRGGGSVMAERR
jgi:CRP/FNR family transcriptional regulator, cyclic AMP receptor protein